MNFIDVKITKMNIAKRDLGEECSMKLINFGVSVDFFVEPAIVAQCSLCGCIECFSDVLRRELTAKIKEKSASIQNFSAELTQKLSS